jgi:hypothetical protein
VSANIDTSEENNEIHTGINKEKGCLMDRHFPHGLLGFRGYHDHPERKRSVFSRHLFEPALRRWRYLPTIEVMEARTTPSITFTGPGNTGLATLTGTSGPDQFVIQLNSL